MKVVRTDRAPVFIAILGVAGVVAGVFLLCASITYLVAGRPKEIAEIVLNVIFMLYMLAFICFSGQFLIEGIFGDRFLAKKIITDIEGVVVSFEGYTPFRKVKFFLVRFTVSIPNLDTSLLFENDDLPGAISCFYPEKVETRQLIEITEPEKYDNLIKRGNFSCEANVYLEPSSKEICGLDILEVY